MSATEIGEKRQTTLPAEVCAAADLHALNQVEWRFEDGEIRGRKLLPTAPVRRVLAKLVRRKGKLFFEPGVKLSAEAIAKAVAEERDSR